MVYLLKVEGACCLSWVGDGPFILAGKDSFVSSPFISLFFVQQKNNSGNAIRIKFFIVQLVSDKIIEI